MKSLFASLACVLLAGCATTPGPKTLTPLDSGHEVHVIVGQTLVLELPGNRTTGYSWNERSAESPVVERLGAPEYLENAHPPGMVGVGGIEIRRFRATKAGNQALRLEYARPWEKNVAPAKTVLFNVVVGR